MNNLNLRIPEGNDMVKRAPFATIPEQHERLKEHIQNKNKIEKPELSGDELN